MPVRWLRSLLKSNVLAMHRATQKLNIPISRVVVWSVENRYGLLSTFQDVRLMPESMAHIISRVCQSNCPAA